MIGFRYLSVGICLLIFAACGEKNETVKFRFNPPDGDLRKGRVELDASSTLRLFTQVTFKLHLDGNINQEEDGIEADQNIWIKQSLEQVKLDFVLDQTLFGNDALEGQLDEQSQELARKYDNGVIRVEYSPLGTVKQTQVTQIGTQTADNDSLVAGMANLERLLGKDFLNRLAGFQATLPENAVRIGDQWTTTSTQLMLGLPVKLVNTYTFSSRESGLATFTLNGQYSMDTAQLEGGKVSLPFDGFELPVSEQVRFLIKGTQQGQMIVEEKTGWTRSSTLEQQVLMEFRLGALTIPVTVTNNIRTYPAGGQSIQPTARQENP